MQQKGESVVFKTDSNTTVVLSSRKFRSKLCNNLMLEYLDGVKKKNQTPTFNSVLSKYFLQNQANLVALLDPTSWSDHDIDTDIGGFYPNYVDFA